MLPAGELVGESLHLWAVTHGVLDHAPFSDRPPENEGVAKGGACVACQHTECGGLTCSVNSQQTKTLHKTEQVSNNQVNIPISLGCPNMFRMP